MWDADRAHTFLLHLMTPQGFFYAETEYSSRQWMLRLYMTTQFSPTTSVTINMGSQTPTWQQLAQNCQNSVKDCQLLYFFVRAFNSGFHQKSQLCNPNQVHKTPRFQPGLLQLLMTTAFIPAHPVLHCNASPLPPLPLSLCHMQLILAAIKNSILF